MATPTDRKNLADMDDAAEKAAADLDDRLKQNKGQMTAKELVSWMRDNFRDAGYKRLARIMLDKF